ncbi:MAG: CPBP family intramembrane glutamic endopeptidase [Candidatus Binatia bacterium]
MQPQRYRPIAEALALLVATFPLAVGLHLPTLWFLLPFGLVTLTKRSFATYGLSLRRPGAPAFHAAVLAAVFLPYALGHYLLAHWWSGMHFHFRLPPSFLQALIDQVLLIGLSEEFFFRGYLQTECDRSCGKPYTFLGARWGLGLPIAAALFAVCHLAHGGPARLLVFFPGLLYGWLRARTDTILVPALYHAFSNLLMQVMMASLSR